MLRADVSRIEVFSIRPFPLLPREIMDFRSFPERIKIVDVGPRDGLQNEKTRVSVTDKIELIDALGRAGVPAIEAGSFVSPAWVPQMADTAEVLAGVKRLPGVSYPVLVPNMRGLEAAIDAGAMEVAVFGSASETFSRRNLNCTISESLQRFRPVCETALRHGLKVRGYVSCTLGCPYEGDISPAAVADIAGHLVAMGCYEISLGDTIGVGTPVQARTMVATVMRTVSASQLALHFHDTCGQALANIVACLGLGITVIDSAVAGLGGCPYAVGASGNVATEDVAYMLHGMGIETGIDLATLIDAGRAICRILGREPASKVARAFIASEGRILRTTSS